MSARLVAALACVYFALSGTYALVRARILGKKGQAWNRRRNRPMTPDDVKRVSFFFTVAGIVQLIGAAALALGFILDYARFGLRPW